jgi:predicted kinase
MTTYAPLSRNPIPDTKPAVEPGPLVQPAPGTVPGRVLVAYRGRPGSGKTTHADAWVTALRLAGTPAARVSRDDVRAALRRTPGGTPDRSDRVTAVHHAVVARLFEHGIHVVLIDDTHLDEHDLTATADLAQHLRATLHVADLRAVPATRCLGRDTRRRPGHGPAVRQR